MMLRHEKERKRGANDNSINNSNQAQLQNSIVPICAQTKNQIDRVNVVCVYIILSPLLPALILNTQRKIIHRVLTVPLVGEIKHTNSRLSGDEA